MTTALAPDFTVTEDELQVIAARVGLAGFPVVLGVRPRYGSVDVLTAALDHATEALVSRGLISEGAVCPELLPLLAALERPDRELAMRLATPEGMARVCVVRRGGLGVLARRVGAEIVLRVLEAPADLAQVTRALIAELPRGEAAQIPPVGAPLEAMSQKLSGSHDPAQIADGARALGAETRTAMLLGSALGSRVAFAEIVYYALSAEADRITRRRLGPRWPGSPNPPRRRRCREAIPAAPCRGLRVRSPRLAQHPLTPANRCGPMGRPPSP